MSLISIFVCAYGVTTEGNLKETNSLLKFFFFLLLFLILLAAMYPSSPLDMELIRRVVTKAYWPIYGTIQILDDFDRFNTNCTANNDCPDRLSFGYSYLLLMVYMVIGKPALPFFFLYFILFYF